jgi:signal transduction histidine kinase
MKKRSALLQTTSALLLGALLLAGVYLTSLYSYLLFHSLIELFTITVAAGVFVIAWNARSYLNNNYLLFVGSAVLFVALLDLLHTLAYKGMGVFADSSGNPATQLWLAGRYLQSLSLLAAPFFLGRKLRVSLQLLVYALVTALLIASIFSWRIFPVAYLEGTGLTPFKKISEYAVSGLFLVSAGLLLRKRRKFDRGVLRNLVLFLIFTIGAEIAFSDYVSVYGGANLIGHFLRLIAYYLLYKAIIETGLVKPYALLLRDLKITEDCLRDQAAALQTRNEELDAYAHTVAHNLKNPLTIIISTADVLTEVDNLTHEELMEFTRQIRSTAYEMNGIIDNLLLLAEVRKADAPSEPVDMGRVVATIRKRLGPMVKEYQARILTPKTWPAALGYAPWIEEVWANYLSNALKYGGRSPCVELGASLQADGAVRFWVRDNGQGLSVDEQASLFVPFTRLVQDRKSGHGLGLSIVRNIVEKMGGRVGVESELGKGSLFFFTLPPDPSVETRTAVAAQPSAQKLRQAV